ncbi:MAG: hypothetical protein ACK56I_25635 [bacterium]
MSADCGCRFRGARRLACGSTRCAGTRGGRGGRSQGRGRCAQGACCFGRKRRRSLLAGARPGRLCVPRGGTRAPVGEDDSLGDEDAR